jgi:putative PIG3 family NAD(P)H quinone oxidoreductase
MNAIVISRPGPPEVLQWAERPRPTCANMDVLIRVHAAGVNRADLLQREGKYPAPAGVPADIPGLEVAGEIVEAGRDVKRWRVGDRVGALLAGGGYAEYVAVPAGHCLPVPPGCSYNDAAALPEAMFTVWHNVFQRGRLAGGERLLVHGGTSGIGMAAIQLARARGARVFATAGTDEKCRACERAGAERAINYRDEDFAAALAQEGVDVILDMVGGDYTPRNLRLLREEGRLVYINAIKGGRAEFDAHRIMSRRLTITGSTLRSRDAGFKGALAAEVEQYVWPLIASGQIRASVFAVHPLPQAAEAHRLVAAGSHIGKVVLQVMAGG